MYGKHGKQSLFPTLRETTGFEDCQVYTIGGARLQTLAASLESEISARGAGPEKWLLGNMMMSPNLFQQVRIMSEYADISDEQCHAFIRHRDVMPSIGVAVAVRKRA